MKKVAVIGAGFVGATTAQRIAEKNMADVVMVDIPEMEGPTKGKALDMLEAAPLVGFEAKIEGTSDYAAIEGSQVVVVTAGVPRRPGMSREDLININKDIIRSVTEQVVRYAPEAIYIVVTNPLDAMVYAAFKLSGFPPERVIGQSGALDSTRFRAFIAMELGVSPRDVHALVIGGHTDVGMVPLVSCASVAGIPLTKLLPKERIDALVERTRRGGTEIVQLFGDGSAYYAPSAGVANMVESILLDEKRIIPSACYLRGEYGIEDLYLGVPAVLGAKGVERILEIELAPEEREQLKMAARIVRETVQKVQI